MAKTIDMSLLVDKSSNRVVFAESKGQFVEVLLSFLTLPLTTIRRLTFRNNPLGSLGNLEKSLMLLKKDSFLSETCRLMLSHPLISAEKLLTALPINYASGRQLFSKYNSCSKRSCSVHWLSSYMDTRCSCGRLMNRKLHFGDVDAESSNGQGCIFLQDSVEYLISDDLLVYPSLTEVAVELLDKLDIKQGSSLESKRVNITAETVLKLLDRLLISNTALTDVFLGTQENHKVMIFKSPCHQLCKQTATAAATDSESFFVKLFLNKEENKVLFAEADKQFVDLLMSFLTYPMGSVIKNLSGESGIRCFDNLYKSTDLLESSDCFKHDEMVEVLQNPALPPYFSLKNKLIEIDDQPATGIYFACENGACTSDEIFRNCHICSACDKLAMTQFTFIDPHKLTGDDGCDEGGYVRSSSYMVTDDLVVNKLSSIGFLTRFAEEVVKGVNIRKFEIGKHEALVLLKASISSKTVLTDAFLGKGHKRPRN